MIHIVAILCLLAILSLLLPYSDALDTSSLNGTFYIEDVSHIEILAKLVLMRDNVIINPSAVTDIDENMMEKLMDFISVNQNRRHTAGGRLILPTLDRRDIGCDSVTRQDGHINALCNVVTAQCLATEDIMEILPRRPVTLAQGIAYTCPLLLFRLASPICTAAEAHSYKEPEKIIKLVEPSSNKVWGFGVLFCTLSIVVSMGGLIVLPFLKREARRTILTLFEGLAVGGLVGSAVIHLFPKAYNITQERFRQYFSRIFVVFAGIYLFYIVERILKIFAAYRNGKSKKPGVRRRNSSFRDDHFVMNLSPMINRGSVPVLTPSALTVMDNIVQQHQAASKLHERSSSVKSAQTNSTKDQLDKCLASVCKSASQPVLDHHLVAHHQSKNSLNQLAEQAKTATMTSKQSYVPDIAGRREDHHTAVNRLSTDSVAWMIVLGDASLNFIDGLSIGAAFDRNILAGISISIAIMLEEVPHRLGTFAVLIRAGMEMKQSFGWIFISACFLYPGLVIGVFLGDAAEDASPYIFALAGGMFLYMALVDVMKEMNNSMENALRKGFKSGFKILALQNLGIIIAIIILSVLALYEQDMDFEAVELQEFAYNSLQR